VVAEASVVAAFAFRALHKRETPGGPLGVGCLLATSSAGERAQNAGAVLAGEGF
jgi:hypothetical protein